MKSSWIPLSVLPAAFLLVDGVALAEDQSSSGSQSSSSETGGSAAPTPAPAEKPKPTIAERKENQQDRIANGVKSGRLTAGETAKLEWQQQGINKQEAADWKANGGKLNASQKQQINREQNAASRGHSSHEAQPEDAAGSTQALNFSPPRKQARRSDLGWGASLFLGSTVFTERVLCFGE